MIINYAIFKTSWGYCALAGTEKGILSLILPCESQKQVQLHLFSALEHLLSCEIRPNPAFAHDLQKWICEYFGQKYPSNVPAFTILAPNASDFARKVWSAISKIKPGQTLTYTHLAQKIGRPLACRAVASACGANPVPLLIPCHRVIRTDGGLGGFSAPGGTELKSRLLKWEQQMLV